MVYQPTLSQENYDNADVSLLQLWGTLEEKHIFFLKNGKVETQAGHLTAQELL